MTVAVGDVLRISGRQTFASDEDDIVGVFHYDTAGATVSDAQALLDAGIIMESIYGTTIARTFTDVEYEEITVKNVTQNTILGQTPWPTFTIGTLAGDALPPQIAALVLATTSSPTRQGRKFTGGFTETDNDGGDIQSLLLTSLANYATNYVLSFVLGGVTYRPIIMTSPDGPLQPTFPLLIGKVITAFRTQRRRTKGRGS